MAHSKKHFRVGLRNDDPRPKEKHDDFMKEFHRLVQSPIPDIFENRWEMFKIHQPKELVDYVWNTWLGPYRHRIVWAWTDESTHFGHRSSSRIEGSHHIVKSFIKSSTGDLYNVYEKLTLFWRNQHTVWKQNIADDKIKRPLSTMKPLYIRVVGHVTNFALKRIHEQWVEMKKATGDPPTHCPSYCQYTTVWGLPCKHVLAQRLQYPGHLHLSDIHRHWYYDRDLDIESLDNPATVIEPNVRHRRQHARGVSHRRGRGGGSTRRDTLHEERLVQGLQQEGQRRRQLQNLVGVERPAPNQHTVYEGSTGSFVGSGTAAPRDSGTEPPPRSGTEAPPGSGTEAPLSSTALPTRPRTRNEMNLTTMLNEMNEGARDAYEDARIDEGDEDDWQRFINL